MLLHVVFDPGAFAVEVEPGTTLLEASERAGLDIPTGCTQGMCGTDAIRIVEGLERLAPPADHEAGTLERMGLRRPKGVKDWLIRAIVLGALRRAGATS